MLSEPPLFQPLKRDFLKWWLSASPDHLSGHLQRAIDWITDAHVAPLGEGTCAEHFSGLTCRHQDDVAPCAGVKDLA